MPSYRSEQDEYDRLHALINRHGEDDVAGCGAAVAKAAVVGSISGAQRRRLFDFLSRTSRVDVSVFEAAYDEMQRLLLIRSLFELGVQTGQTFARAR